MSRGSIDNESALVKVKTWLQIGHWPLPKPLSGEQDFCLHMALIVIKVMSGSIVIYDTTWTYGYNEVNRDVEKGFIFQKSISFHTIIWTTPITWEQLSNYSYFVHNSIIEFIHNAICKEKHLFDDFHNQLRSME